MTSSKKSLEGLTDKQLESEWTKASKALEDAKKQCLAYSHESQRRETKRRVEQALAGFSESDREFLLQGVEALGIESEEDVKGTAD